jgi:hypothetical protein
MSGEGYSEGDTVSILSHRPASSSKTMGNDFRLSRVAWIAASIRSSQ